MTFPEWLAGMQMTASRMNARNTFLVEQQTNQVINNEGNLQDTDIVIPMEANAIYHVSLYAALRASTASDLIIAWSVPDGSSSQRFVNGVGTGATGTSSSATEVSMFAPAGGLSASPVGGLGVNTSVTYIEEIVTATASAGSMVCQFAQATPGGTNAEFRAFSRALYRRIG